MRKAIKTVLFTLFGLSAILVFLALDFSPILNKSNVANVNNADSVQSLLNELKSGLRNRYNEQKINVSHDQATSLAGFIHRAVKQAKAQVEFTNSDIYIRMSYQLIDKVLPMYINVTAQINEGEGLRLVEVSVGSLSIPGDFALWASEALANSYTSSQVASIAIDTVKAVAIFPDKVQVSLNPIDKLLREFKNIETGGDSEDTRLLKIKIAHYLRLLDNLYINQVQLNEGVSLLSYLQAVFAEAKIQSKSGSATLENEAAILAVAIYAGSYRFTTLIGDLSFAINKIPQPKYKPILKGRQDLSLHFVFSAAIKLMSQKGISIAVGEFKELMDRGQGGTGYSFIDLAADLAGAHFAELAVQPESALILQAVMSTATMEDVFMVSIEGLEEGLSKTEFETKYFQVDSPEYKKMVDIINQRLSELPINP